MIEVRLFFEKIYIIMYIQESYDYMSNLPPTDLLIKNNNEYK